MNFLKVRSVLAIPTKPFCTTEYVSQWTDIIENKLSVLKIYFKDGVKNDLANLLMVAENRGEITPGEDVGKYLMILSIRIEAEMFEQHGFKATKVTHKVISELCKKLFGEELGDEKIIHTEKKQSYMDANSKWKN